MICKCKFSFLILIMLTISFACKSQSDKSAGKDKVVRATINLEELKRYFQVDSIDYSYENEVFKLTISNPKGEDKIDSLSSPKIEDYSTIGALILTDIVKNISIDSLKMRFTAGSASMNIAYKYSDLLLIKKEAQLGITFLRKVNEKKYEEADSFLNNSLLQNNATLIRKIYGAMNILGEIDKVQLVKFKIYEDGVDIFLNAIYKSGDINTYVLVFPPSNSKQPKIIGMRTKA